MIRRIIQIDENKCNGCGACANACHEGAIAMVNGSAMAEDSVPRPVMKGQSVWLTERQD
mgnify:CR=1 FL=1